MDVASRYKGSYQLTTKNSKEVAQVFPWIYGNKQALGKNQALVRAIPLCVEYPGPRFKDEFRSANQIDGISIVDGGKMADS